MKRFIVSIILMYIFIALSASKMTPHFKKCTKCQEDYGKNNVYITPGIMRRDFGTLNKHKDVHIYACYRCQYGHVVWVCIDED